MQRGLANNGFANRRPIARMSNCCCACGWRIAFRGSRCQPGESRFAAATLASTPTGTDANADHESVAGGGSERGGTKAEGVMEQGRPGSARVPGSDPVGNTTSGRDPSRSLFLHLAMQSEPPSSQLRSLQSPISLKTIMLDPSGDSSQLINVNTGSTKAITLRNWNGLRSVKWSPDGKGFFAFNARGIAQQSTVPCYVDLRGRVTPLWVHKGLTRATHVSPSPDGPISRSA